MSFSRDLVQRVLQGLGLSTDSSWRVSPPVPQLARDWVKSCTSQSQPCGFCDPPSSQVLCPTGTSLSSASGGSITKGTPTSRPPPESPITYRGSITHVGPLSPLGAGSCSLWCCTWALGVCGAHWVCRTGLCSTSVMLSPHGAPQRALQTAPTWDAMSGVP